MFSYEYVVCVKSSECLLIADVKCFCFSYVTFVSRTLRERLSANDLQTMENLAIGVFVFFFNEINSNRSNDWFNVLMEQKNRCIARLIIFKAVSYVSERKNWTWLLNHKHKHKHLCVPVERLHHTRYCSIHFKTLAVYIALSSVAVLFALAARNER